MSREKDSIELKQLLMGNFINNKFNRVDVLVIKHSIEQYLKDEKYDFDLYIKMQELRGYSEEMFSSRISEILIERIKKLIKSFEEKGFDDNFDEVLSSKAKRVSGIEDGSIDRTWLEHKHARVEDKNKGQPFMFSTEFRLVNGAHRLAYAYLKNITPVLVFSYTSPVEAAQIIPYSIEWFEERFSTKDLEIINNEVDELKKYLKND
jgi:hypothetical protein